MSLRQGSRLAAIGVTIRSSPPRRGDEVLYGIQSSDRLTFTVVPIVLIVVALLEA